MSKSVRLQETGILNSKKVHAPTASEVNTQIALHFRIPPPFITSDNKTITSMKA